MSSRRAATLKRKPGVRGRRASWVMTNGTVILANAYGGSFGKQVRLICLIKIAVDLLLLSVQVERHHAEKREENQHNKQCDCDNNQSFQHDCLCGECEIQVKSSKCN